MEATSTDGVLNVMDKLKQIKFCFTEQSTTV